MLWLTLLRFTTGSLATRRAAAEKLGHANSPRALQALLAALPRSSEDVASSASRDPQVDEMRAAVVRAVGQIGDQKAVAPLLTVLNDWLHEKSELRIAAAEALAIIERGKAIDNLLRLISNDDGLSEAATRILDRIDPAWRSSATGRQALAEQRVDRAKTLLRSFTESKTMYSNMGQREERKTFRAERAEREFRQALADVEALEDTVRALVRLGNYDTTEAFQKTVTKVGRPAVEALCQMLANPEEEVRELVVETLCMTRDAAATVPFAGTLRLDSSPRVRRQIAYYLGGITDATATDALADVLNDPEAVVRAEAAFALARLGDVRAVQGLMEILTDPPHWSTRFQAASGETASNLLEQFVGRPGGPDMEQLCEIVCHGKAFADKVAALAVLSRAGSAAVDRLIERIGEGGFRETSEERLWGYSADRHETPIMQTVCDKKPIADLLASVDLARGDLLEIVAREFLTHPDEDVRWSTFHSIASWVVTARETGRSSAEIAPAMGFLERVREEKWPGRGGNWSTDVFRKAFERIDDAGQR